MPDKPNKRKAKNAFNKVAEHWKTALLGKAQTVFNRATKPPPTAKTVEARKLTPEMNGPKPPAGLGRVATEQAFKDRAQEAAKKDNPPYSGKLPKPVIELEHLKEGAKLREKFHKAAQREQDKGR